MKFIHKTIGVLAVGFVVLTLWSVLLYWPCEGCKKVITESARYYEIAPFSVIKKQIRIPEISDQPIEELQISSVFSGINQDDSGERSSYGSYIALPEIYIDYYDNIAGEPWRNMVYFDRSLGQFVQCRIWRDYKKITKEIVTYAGPKGMSVKPDKNLGRFNDFVVPTFNFLDRILLFDQGDRRFYLLNFNERTVRASREYLSADECNPAAIDEFGDRSKISFQYRIPGTRGSKEMGGVPEGKDIALILNQNGRLDWFNLDKMDFTGQAGYVPNFSDAYAYRIRPVLWADSGKGLVVVSFSMKALVSATQVVFDPKGQVVQTDERVDFMSRMSVFHVTRFFLENLYSPVMLFAAAANAMFEKSSNSRMYLYLPMNSTLTMCAELEISNYFDYMVKLVLIVVPAMLLSLLLALRVKKDAIRFGLTKSACGAWCWLTVAFGVPAYITWRIVRPKEVMVTCQNCGKLRRVEFERCQHCKSLWLVPEITPPNWQVKTSAEPKAE
jgi:hypothetical protein